MSNIDYLFTLISSLNGFDYLNSEALEQLKSQTRLRKTEYEEEYERKKALKKAEGGSKKHKKDKKKKSKKHHKKDNKGSDDE